MKKRASFGLVVVILISVILAAELLLQRRPTAILTVSTTPTPSLAPTIPELSFEHFPTRPPVTTSPTSIPLQATHTSLGAETPDVLATQTLLSIHTPTLLPSDTPPTDVPTQTLIFFASMTSTPFRGTATPPVSVAYSIDGKPKTCYKGPSLAYIEMDTFIVSRIAGKDVAGAWWFLLVSKGQGVYVSCWVMHDQVTTGGNLTELSVVEPELPQVTQVKVSAVDQPATDAEYIATIVCDDGITNTTLHFLGQIFANGPIEDIGYRWDTSAPINFNAAHTSIESWDAPAQTRIDLPVPSTAGEYSLSLLTTFPMEAVGELRVTVKCK